MKETFLKFDHVGVIARDMDKAKFKEVSSIP